MNTPKPLNTPITPSYTVNGVRLYAPCSGMTGYSYYGLGLAQELNKLTNLGLMPLEGNIDTRTLDQNLSTSLHIAETLPRNTPAIILSMGGRSSFFRATGNPLVGYNMWESDRPPAAFIDALKEMDEVWVPSTWGAECYRKAGVETAVSMPGGVNPYLFSDMTPKHPELSNLGGDVFKFLAVGKWERRKGYDLLLKAWSKVFKPNEKAVLVLAMFNVFIPNFNPWKAIVSQHTSLEAPPLVVIERPIQSYGEMASIYAACDAFVQPTRGEGWNMPLIEAMSTGLPSITTNWSAHTEFVSKDTNYLLDYELVPAKNDPQWQAGFEGSNWAEPNFDQLCEYLRYVFDNREEARKIGAAAAKHVRENFTWRHAAERVMKRLKEIVP